MKTDPGQAYRYVWNVAPLLGGNPAAQLQFRNGSDAGGPTLELRLLQAEADNRYTSATPPQAPEPAPARPRSGWGGVLDALKDVAKDVTTKPSPTTAAVTPPASEPAATVQSPYGSPSAQGQTHLAIYAVGRMLGHGDFDYPVVVQLLDGTGRPMYPASPLVVTLASNNPDVVTMYLPNRPASTTLTLKPADRSGAGGSSWEMVRVIAANHWVAGSATLTATAPGIASGSVTVSTLPTRTQDNRSTPAQSAPAARLSFMVMPPIVETNRLAFTVMDLLDATGEPTGVAFGPGEWTIQSSNPAVLTTYSSTTRNGQVGSYPSAPGTTQLTLVSKRPGLTGGTATLTAVAPGTAIPSYTAAPPPPPPSPPAVGTVGRVAPGVHFGEDAPPATGRITNIVTARAVRGGVAVDITDRFTPDVNPIHVWFRVSGFGFGTTLLSKWTYLGGAQPLVIGTADVVLEPANDWATFNYELAPGKRWPAGAYLIEILLGNSVVGRTTFDVIR